MYYTQINVEFNERYDDSSNKFNNIDFFINFLY